MENKHLVALVLDNDNKCCHVAQVQNIDDKEYNKRKNEERAYKDGLEEEKQNVNRSFMEVANHINHLEGNEVYLAKAIYDNFVDRGFLKEDEEFQKHFFDHIFKGVKLNEEKTPTEFFTILRKVEYHNEKK